MLNLGALQPDAHCRKSRGRLSSTWSCADPSNLQGTVADLSMPKTLEVLPVFSYFLRLENDWSNSMSRHSCCISVHG